jgi:superfamily II DNA/RNA helicase
VVQVVQVCAEHKKTAKLMKHLAGVRAGAAGRRAQPRLLIFANRIKTARYLHREVAAAGWRAALLHGDRPQEERDAAVQDFRSGKAQVLVATDVAARGLDIRNLPYVVNYDFPPDLDTYVHRVGRAGRLAADGHAYSFLTRELAPLARPLAALLEAHAQPLDPNLLKLAEAYEVAAAKLGIDPGARPPRGRAAEAEGGGEEAGGGGGSGDEAEAAGSGGGGQPRLERVARDEVLHALGMRSQLQKKRDKAAAGRRQRGGTAAAAGGSDGDSDSDGGGGEGEGEGRRAPAQEFVPAKRFGGARAGYIFKRGGLGVGYYVDRPPLQQLKAQQQRQAAAAAAAKGKRVGGGAPGDAPAKPAPLLPGRAKQLLKRQRAASGGASDSEGEAEGAGQGGEAASKGGRPKQLPGRLRKKLARERAERD